MHDQGGLRPLGHSKKRLAQPETLPNSQGLSHLESAEMQRERVQKCRGKGGLLDHSYFAWLLRFVGCPHFRFPMEALYFPEHFVKPFGLVYHFCVQFMIYCGCQQITSYAQ